jgi:predicted solute-binding protein
VWGFLHSPDPVLRQTVDLRFALPSECADQLATGEADIGIVPVIEMARQKLDYFRGTGIACHGPVRTILLISKVPYGQIRTLAADAASRTSVMLARVILAEKYGTEPKLVTMPADLAAMLGEADAALIIGDPALHLEPETLPFATLDLGAEWTSMTGLPMVFAVWAGRKEIVSGPNAARYSRPSSIPAAMDSIRWTLW